MKVIELTSQDARRRYPKWLRLVRYYDTKRDESFEFITNNQEMSGRTIADVYKARWQIEGFFNFIKQNLKIKTFLGTSQNAVLTQIWRAMCYLYYLHRLIRAGLLLKITIIDLLGLNERRLSRADRACLERSRADTARTAFLSSSKAGLSDHSRQNQRPRILFPNRAYRSGPTFARLAYKSSEGEHHE